MQRIENTPVWFGLWDASVFAPGSHTIEVRAQGSSVMIDRVTTSINPALYMEDSDDDGILDVSEDANHNGMVDSGETDPHNPDTDSDGIQDGTELGFTSEDIEPDTDTAFFEPDLDPRNKKDTFNPDQDGNRFQDAIEQALLRALTEPEQWQQWSTAGIQGTRKHYSWHAHASPYMETTAALPGRYKPIPSEQPVTRVRYRDRAIFTDLDQNLVGNPTALKRFIEVMKANRKCVTFGIATGRRIDTALALMKKQGIPRPDVLISSLGTRIHYGSALTEDDYWTQHIDHHWNPKQIRKTLDALPGLKLQSKKERTPFKISYYIDTDKASSVEEIIALLRTKELTANVISSFGQFLDIVPSRASKGQALRYVSQRLDIPLEHTLTAGGSGADEDMMRGNTLAVVVANRHDEELSQLIDQERIYFAGQPHAAGIMEALEHYDFFRACQVAQEE